MMTMQHEKNEVHKRQQSWEVLTKTRNSFCFLHWWLYAVFTIIILAVPKYLLIMIMLVVPKCLTIIMLTVPVC